MYFLAVFLFLQPLYPNNNYKFMKKSFILFFVLIFCIIFSLSANDKNQMKNMHVSIAATAHKYSRFLGVTEYKNKTYVVGKKSSYDKAGEAKGKKTVWPYAEYSLASNLAGGTYVVNVHYSINKDEISDRSPKILLGMDTLEPQELILKNKITDTVKATFKVKILRGEKHTLKVWLPSRGVQISKFEVRKALISKM